MPAIMMMPASGVLDSVTGSSSDIAETGPMPGSTPTSVPMKTPKKQDSRLIGWRATAETVAERGDDFHDRSSAEPRAQQPVRQLNQQELAQHVPDAERGGDRM